MGARESRYNLKPGSTLGRNYFVAEFLGCGWEGEVYKVSERRTGVMRAAKIFYDHRRPNEAQMRRYAQKMYRLRSCPIITQYHHRDIARVKRDSVEVLVSDFCEGEMLSAFLDRQPGKRLPTFEALHLMYALTVGIEQIHHLGEYHGDVHSDNILVVRRGLGFEVHLLDFFDLGRFSRQRAGEDVIDLITVLYEAIGGAAGYRRAGPEIRGIIRGRKHSLIRKSYRTAGQLRTALDHLEWGT